MKHNFTNIFRNSIIALSAVFLVPSLSFGLGEQEFHKTDWGAWSGGETFEAINFDGTRSEGVHLEPVFVTGTTIKDGFGGVSPVDQTIIVRGPNNQIEPGDKYGIVRAVLPAIVFTKSFDLNETLIARALDAIRNLKSPVAQLAALRNLYQQVAAAIKQGLPMPPNILISIGALANSAKILISYDAAAAIPMEGLVAGAATVGAAAIVAGAVGAGIGYGIYSNSNWIQNGGLDPIMRTVDNIIYNSGPTVRVKPR